MHVGLLLPLLVASALTVAVTELDRLGLTLGVRELLGVALLVPLPLLVAVTLAL